MNPLAFVKPAVQAVRAYTLVPRAATVKVDQNENPFDLPEDLKRDVLERALARPWSRYPPFEPRELCQELARFAGWPPEGVLAGNGSNELIQALLLVTVGAGTRVAIPEPTFTLYALLTTILGGEVVRVPLGPDLAYEPAALLAAQRASRPALTIVCSPNNPTGGALATEDVARLCAANEGLVAVDEAYHEFSGQTVAPLLPDYPNLVVLRTFSKAMALAGLRVGYLLAAPDLVREVNKARLPYNLNFFSQAVALSALAGLDRLQANVARIVRGRERLLGELEALPGVRPFPSRANFVLFELQAHDPATVFARLLERGVLVRDVTSYPRLGRCLRVSVGAESDNAAFLAALREALAEPPAAAEARP